MEKKNKFFQVPNGVQVWLIVHFETSLFHLLCIIFSVNVMKFAFWDTRVTLNRKKKNPIRKTTDWQTFSNHLWHETCVSKCCFFLLFVFFLVLLGGRGDLLQIIKISNFCGYNFPMIWCIYCHVIMRCYLRKPLGKRGSNMELSPWREIICRPWWIDRLKNLVEKRNGSIRWDSSVVRFQWKDRRTFPEL